MNYENGRRSNVNFGKKIISIYVDKLETESQYHDSFQKSGNSKEQK